MGGGTLSTTGGERHRAVHPGLLEFPQRGHLHHKAFLPSANQQVTLHHNWIMPPRVAAHSRRRASLSSFRPDMATVRLFCPNDASSASLRNGACRDVLSRLRTHGASCHVSGKRKSSSIRERGSRSRPARVAARRGAEQSKWIRKTQERNFLIL